jgi:hypothetical protein
MMYTLESYIHYIMISLNMYSIKHENLLSAKFETVLPTES